MIFTLLVFSHKLLLQSYDPANIYLCKVSDRNTRKMCKVCSKLTIKKPEWHQWCFSVSLVLTLKRYLFTGKFIYAIDLIRFIFQTLDTQLLCKCWYILQKIWTVEILWVKLDTKGLKFHQKQTLPTKFLPRSYIHSFFNANFSGVRINICKLK